MAKEVGIKIKLTSEGQEVVVRNLVELEKELLKLQELLKTQTFGSKEFAQTAANISKLKGQIEDVDKAIEGLGAERRFQAITASVGVAVNSFQALSGVVGLFASDSEDLAKIQKAEAQALSVLNIALGVNNALLDLNEAKKLKDIITTKAQTIATNAAALATRVWNAVLSANPIGLVIAGVAALTTAIILFTKETTKSVKSIDELKIQTDEFNKINEEGLKIRDKELEKFIPLINLTEKENISKENRNKAIKAIQKEYPDYLKNQDLEKLTLQDIKKANDDLITSMEKVARSRAAMNELTSIYQEELKIQEGLERAAQSREEQLQKIYAIGDASQVEGQRKVNQGLQAVAEQRAKDARQELEIRKKVALSFIDEGDAIKVATGETNKNTNAVKNASDIILEVIKKRNAAIAESIRQLEQAQGAELGYTSQILEAQKKVLDEQKAFLDSRAETFKTSGEKIVEEINDFLFKTIPSLEDTKKLTDGYADLFKIIDEAVKSGELDFRTATGWDDFVKFAQTNLPEIAEKLVNVNEESRKSFVEYFNSLDQRLDKIKTAVADTDLGKLLGITGDVEDLKTLRNVEETISNLRRDAVNLGLTDLDVRERSIKVIKEQFGIQKQVENITKQILNNTFLIESAETSEETKEKLKARNTELTQTLKNYDELATTILEGVLNTDKFIEGLRLVGVEADKNKEEIDKLKGSIDAALSPEQFEGIKEYFKSQAGAFDSILTDIFNKPQEYFDKLGKDGLKALFQGLEEGLPEIEGQTRQELEKLSSFLQIVGDELAESLGLEENPFKKFIEDATNEIKKLPTAAEEAYKETIDNLNDIADVILRVFTDISSRIQTILQTQTSMLLEELQYEQEAALALIGEANSENAEENARILAEQEKAQKKFAKARFEIEKKARVQELQFGLANAIASSAQAVIQALALPAPPPIPQLYAGVVGGLSAVQIALIREQIQTAQSRVFIGRRGGLIQGASHEGGGVPAMLEGGEFVLSRPAVEQYGDIISGINSSVGGRALQIDDSRIVQAIASQNTSKTPIKTYVLYNDIQSTDKLNKKIENLSKL